MTPSVVFVGDPNDPSDKSEGVAMFGHFFPRGEPVEVDDIKAFAKLQNNSHFQTTGEAAPAPKRRGRPPKERREDPETEADDIEESE